ncbi:hypothetical protein [Streptomyces hainanensis]|uniref:Uncharacterized protein n=1 Tax=Streptomyces hainanensis TaxID=402648 RepID=A0A4R4TA12_9ACTN|nr:hypothetical protein [Streptomyces hainanensis]TDC73967.1 hypothetical protein E1283_17450 [Streptomyces hainanensis]
MRRTRVLALTSTAIVLTGMATAAATVHRDGAAGVKPAATAPLAAHNRFDGPPTTIQPGGFGSAEVTCPAGQVPTGGGHGTSAFDIYVTDSVPLGTGWFVVAKNIGNTAQTVRAVVVCTVP